jgi:alkylhydroperoxidase/carboxymuconolactone decarboxylase family protein YurZ
VSARSPDLEDAAAVHPGLAQQAARSTGIAINDMAHTPAGATTRHDPYADRNESVSSAVPRQTRRATLRKRWARTVKRKGRTMTEPSDDTPVLDLLAEMTAASLAASSLDAQTLALVRVAALVAVDAPPISYALNLDAAAELGIDGDQVRGVLAAIAPIVGTARVASATGKIVKALAVEIEIAEQAQQAEA